MSRSPVIGQPAPAASIWAESSAWTRDQPAAAAPVCGAAALVLIVVLEAVAPGVPGVVYPRLVEARTAQPCRDVGGPWGYGEFLEAVADPARASHVDLMEWCGGGFDPQPLDMTESMPPRLACAPQSAGREPPSRLHAE